MFDVFWFLFVLLYSHTRRTLLSLCLCLCLGFFGSFQVPASLFNRVMVEFANSNKTLWIFKMSKADEQQKLTKGGKKRWQKKFFKKQEKQKENRKRAWIWRLQNTQRSRNLCVDCATTPWIFVSQNTIVHTQREK